LLPGGFLCLKKRPLCRADGAEDASPGQRPGDHSQISSSALKGRMLPAPFQGGPHYIHPETQGVALGWLPAALSAPEDGELTLPHATKND
jgi:hypothetical protein